MGTELSGKIIADSAVQVSDSYAIDTSSRPISKSELWEKTSWLSITKDSALEMFHIFESEQSSI